MVYTIKNKYRLLLGIALCALAVVITILAFAVRRADAVDVLKEQYPLYSTLNIPEYVIEYDGGSVAATGYSLRYPDGIVKSGKVHELDIPGEYTVYYSAQNGADYVKAEKQFIVPNLVYSKQNKDSDSTIVYGRNPQYAAHAAGLVTSLVPDDALNINKIIDLSEMTKDDKILEFYITPKIKGKDNYEATRFHIRFTDIYDENNWLEVNFKCVNNVRGWGTNHVYVDAQTAGNPTKGYTYSLNNELWGLALWSGFDGTAGHIDLYYDNTEKTVWTKLNIYTAHDDGTPIADLDDGEVFTHPWEGFTTGEVKVSFYATSYNSTSFNFVLNKFMDFDFTETEFYDTAEPIITIDTLGNEDIPTGKKGVPYNVFPATATDDYSGKVNVNANVYFKYGKANQVSVSTKNGSFIPEYEGVYTIEYSAKDYFGNESIKTVEVQVENSENSLDFDIIDPITQCVAGENKKLFSGLEIRHAHGKTEIVATVSCNGKTEALGNDYYFMPLNAGTYVVKIELSDYIGKITKSFELNVTANDKPVFTEEANIPDYFISGQEYALKEYSGYDLSSGTAKTLVASAFISEDGGAEKSVGTNAFTVAAKNNVRVIFRITNANYPDPTEKSYVVPVVDAVGQDGKLDVTKFYRRLSGNAVVSADGDYVRISASEDSVIKFANALQTESFEANFRWGSEQAFTGVNFYFTDSENKNVKIKITYTYSDEKGYIAINGGNPVPIPINTATSDRAKLALYYVNGSRQVYGHQSRKLDIKETVYGETFNGFPSNKAYVEFELFGVQGVSELLISKINNQMMYDLNSPDTTQAEIIVKKSNGTVGMGKEVVIYGIHAYDVFSNSVITSLKVIAPDRTFVKAKDGTVLNGTCDPQKNYVIVCEQYGTYRVSYTTCDAYGNEKSLTYAFQSVDTVAPTIQFDNSDVSVSVGDTVSVKTYEVTDDVSATDKIKVSIYVLKPDQIMEVVNGNEFAASVKGEYIVFYYCRDEVGNTTVSQYKVTAN